MLVEFTLTIVLWLGLIGLSIDGGRWIILRQHIAFSASAGAAAGAKQLDQHPGAVNRAKDTAQNIAAANLATLDGLSTGSITGIKACASVNPCVETADDTAAKFIEVSTAGEAGRVFLTPVALIASARATD